MGYIKDPKGVDFEVIPLIKHDPEADKAFSEFLAKEKLKNRKAKDKMVANAKVIIQRYEASRALGCLQEPQSGYNKEPIEDDLIRQITDLTKEEAKEVSEFIRNLKAEGKQS